MALCVGSKKFRYTAIDFSGIMLIRARESIASCGPRVAHEHRNAARVGTMASSALARVVRMATVSSLCTKGFLRRARKSIRPAASWWRRRPQAALGGWGVYHRPFGAPHVGQPSHFEQYLRQVSVVDIQHRSGLYLQDVLGTRAIEDAAPVVRM